MPSFDIVSKVQGHEVDNAVQQAQKEIAQRFDFKDTHTSIEKSEGTITLVSESEERAKAALTVLNEKFLRRKVELSFFEAQEIQKTSKGGARITVELKEGIEAENAKKIVSAFKEKKLKVQTSLQDAQLRVTGKSKDELQGAIELARSLQLGIALQFVNFRD